jgi:hypothetical protein
MQNKQPMVMPEEPVTLDTQSLKFNIVISIQVTSLN